MEDPELAAIDQQLAELERLDQQLSSKSKSGLDKSSYSLWGSTDFVKVIQEYTQDKQIPLDKVEDLQKFWAIFGKDLKLTFIDTDQEIEYFNNLFESAKLSYLMSEPAFKFDFDKYQMLDQLRLNFNAVVRRSKGTDKNKMNERTLQASQGSFSLNTNQGQSQAQGRGLLNWIRRKF